MRGKISSHVFRVVDVRLKIRSAFERQLDNFTTSIVNPARHSASFILWQISMCAYRVQEIDLRAGQPPH